MECTDEDMNKAPLFYSADGKSFSRIKLDKSIDKDLFFKQMNRQRTLDFLSSPENKDFTQ
jgi:hypothetical protein